jgi:PAS domain S-box-containing protein
MVPPDQSADQHREADPSGRFGRLFNLIGDAVVEIELVDTTPIVRSVNAGFESVFGYDRETVVGTSLNEFIIPEGHDTEATSFDERTAVGKPNHAIVRRQTATGVREFLYRGIPYEGTDGRRFGFAIYSDITEQRTYERHIQVIHRLLRHNLRNELTVILGATEMLESDAERDAVAERAAQIRSHAQNLASLGKEAQVLERVLTGEIEPRPLDLAPLCAQACQSVRQTTSGGVVTLDVRSGRWRKTASSTTPARRPWRFGPAGNQSGSSSRLPTTGQESRRTNVGRSSAVTTSRSSITALVWASGSPGAPWKPATVPWSTNGPTTAGRSSV